MKRFIVLLTRSCWLLRDEFISILDGFNKSEYLLCFEVSSNIVDREMSYDLLAVDDKGASQTRALICAIVDEDSVV